MEFSVETAEKSKDERNAAPSLKGSDAVPGEESPQGLHDSSGGLKAKWETLQNQLQSIMEMQARTEQQLAEVRSESNSNNGVGQHEVQSVEQALLSEREQIRQLQEQLTAFSQSLQGVPVEIPTHRAEAADTDRQALADTVPEPQAERTFLREPEPTEVSLSEEMLELRSTLQGMFEVPVESPTQVAEETQSVEQQGSLTEEPDLAAIAAEFAESGTIETADPEPARAEAEEVEQQAEESQPEEPDLAAIAAEFAASESLQPPAVEAANPEPIRVEENRQQAEQPAVAEKPAAAERGIELASARFLNVSPVGRESKPAAEAGAHVEPPLSAAEPNAEETEDPNGVAAYMERLLQRQQKPGSASNAAELLRANRSAQGGNSVEALKPDVATELAKPRNPRKEQPPQDKDKIRAGMSSMRELANMQARRAVAKHQWSRSKKSLKLYGVLAAVGVLITMGLLLGELLGVPHLVMFSPLSLLLTGIAGGLSLRTVSNCRNVAAKYQPSDKDRGKDAPAN